MLKRGGLRFVIGVSTLIPAALASLYKFVGGERKPVPVGIATVTLWICCLIFAVLLVDALHEEFFQEETHPLRKWFTNASS